MNAQVAPSRLPRCADHVVRWLASAGVELVFGVPGGAVSPLYDALVGSPVGVVMNQHEAMAVYSAMGRFHSTGCLQAVAVTSGPGILNTLTPAAAALADEVPVLLLAGEVRRAWSGRGALQDGGPAGLDVEAVFRPVVRAVLTLDDPRDALRVFARARALAMAHPRGPVLIRLPVDVLGEEVEPLDEGAAEPALPPRATDDVVHALAADLRRARRPTLFCGIGARTAGLGERVARLAYRLRAGVVTDIEAKGLIDERDPVALGAYGVGAAGPAGRWLAEGVDLLVTLGARLDDTATAGFADALRAPRFVQVDHDARRLGRPWTPDVALHVDQVDLLDRLLEAVGTPTPAELVARDLELRAVRDRPAELPRMDAAPFHPAAVVRALQDAFPGATFTADIGNHMLFATRHLVLAGPDEFRMSQGLGGMGSGIGLAMGLATARPDRRVVAICGDGGLLMVGNELATCARYHIPAVFAVFDNRSLGMIAHGMSRVYGRASACEVPDVDLVGYGRSLGVRVVDVRREEDLAAAAATAGDGPMLLRIPIDPDQALVNPRDAGFVRVSRG
jgi:acetolactate synthase-1/2/3 large subunit